MKQWVAFLTLILLLQGGLARADEERHEKDKEQQKSGQPAKKVGGPKRGGRQQVAPRAPKQGPRNMGNGGGNLRQKNNGNGGNFSKPQNQNNGGNARWN